MQCIPNLSMSFPPIPLSTFVIKISENDDGVQYQHERYLVRMRENFCYGLPIVSGGLKGNYNCVVKCYVIFYSTLFKIVELSVLY